MNNNTSLDTQISKNGHLDKNIANYTALTPISFLERTANIYPDRIATINGPIKRTWHETYQRCRQLASALQREGIHKDDTVSVIAPNISEHFETHFGVPMAGAILNSINTRLDAPTIAFILQHANSKIVFVDREFGALLKEALELMPYSPLVIDIDDTQWVGGERAGTTDYETFLTQGDEFFDCPVLEDEWDSITLNYTSGTTGDPKGVLYHHRGAYLNSISNAMSWGMTQHPVYLWILPMFHCNGWCFPWTIAAMAGVSVSLRHAKADDVFTIIKQEKVGYLCAAPIILNMLNAAEDNVKSGIEHPVNVMTAGAAPPAAVIQAMESIGFNITHVYGLTETYGPCVYCAWKDEWDDHSDEEKARIKARQGIKAPMLEGLMVADPDSLEPVPQDGKTLGEIFMRGNLVMKGYLNNPATTEKAFTGGWFHSGDLAVWHSDGYVEIKDRSKDIIISGGENISSIEIEDTLYRHPMVQEAAVVAKLDDKWGETPCAFITLKDSALKSKNIVSEDDIIQFCRENMAHFKAPKYVIFGPLPKTSTGKVQKFLLRDQANALSSTSVN